MDRATIDRLPGLKRKDIEGCMSCGRGVAHNHDITFYRLKVERFVLDPTAVNERHGMELMMGGGTGGAVLAQVMGPDRDLAKLVAGPMVMIICEPCAMGGLGETSRPPCLAALAERWTERQEGTGDAQAAG